jgi:hypothetical protein
MPDQRSEKVQKFREEQGALRIHVLTAVTPFTISQDRFVLAEFSTGARLYTCHGCTPRTAFDHGQMQIVSMETLRAFQDRLAAAEDAWIGDAIPAGVSDGVTLTAERAEVSSYRRVRMVEPPVGSAHERLLAAWLVTFPDIAHALT